MLEIDRLSIGFQGPGGLMMAVQDFSMTLNRGEILGLVGESGSGKTLVSLAMMNLLPPAARIVSGSIRLDGEDLPDRNAAAWGKLRGKRIAMIFQDPMASLDPVFTCGQQIIEAIQLHTPLSRVAAREQARALLERVRIADPTRCLGAYPHELSGGMCQRVMIAMALACHPEIIIADEPTTALDVTVQAEVLGLLRELNRSLGATILLITHDLGVVYEIADRVAVMYAGALMEVAPTAALFGHPRNPYTHALIASVPVLGERRTRLAAIDGRVPPVGAMPPGCRFAPRCAAAVEICHAEQPPLMAGEESHFLRCHLGRGAS